MEMIVASGMLALIMMGVYTAFHTGAFGARNIDENIGVYQRAIRVLESLDQDLRNSFSYKPDERKFSGTENSVEFLALVYRPGGDEQVREFAFIRYALEQDQLKRLVLRNKESLNQENLKEEKLKEEELKENSQLKPRALSDKIAELVFSYAYRNQDTKEIAWKSEWSETDKIPLAVKVKLTVKDKTISRDFERVIYLALPEEIHE